MPKMKIFNSMEKEAFDSPPVFNSAERKQFFSLPLLLKDSITDLRTPTNKVCFLAVAGYFKVRHKFFARQFHPADFEYIAHQIGVNPAEVHVGAYSKGSYVPSSIHNSELLRLQPFRQNGEDLCRQRNYLSVPVQYRPKLVLLEIIQILTRQKIEIPSYNVLAGLIIAAINRHRRELCAIVDASLSKKQRASLDALLEKEPDNGTRGGWRYRLTLLKRPFQSTQPLKIRANLADLNTLANALPRPEAGGTTSGFELRMHPLLCVFSHQGPDSPGFTSRRSRPFAAPHRLRCVPDL